MFYFVCELVVLKVVSFLQKMGAQSRCFPKLSHPVCCPSGNKWSTSRCRDRHLGQCYCRKCGIIVLNAWLKLTDSCHVSLSHTNSCIYTITCRTDRCVGQQQGIQTAYYIKQAYQIVTLKHIKCVYLLWAKSRDRCKCSFIEKIGKQIKNAIQKT